MHIPYPLPLCVLVCVYVREETHKVDVIKFAQNKAQECMRNDDLIDKDSAFLIWEFIVLLCRQNGVRIWVCLGVCLNLSCLFFLFLSKSVYKKTITM